MYIYQGKNPDSGQVLKKEFDDEAQDLDSATVHWLRHTAISVDVAQRPREHIRDDAGHENAATVLMALQCLASALPVKPAAITAGLKSATLPGRAQIIPGEIRHVLDVAHNPQSTQYLATKLNQLKINSKIIAVFSMLADKDITNTLAPFNEIIDDWNVAPLAVPRAATSEQMIKELTLFTNSINYFDNITQAFKMANLKAESTDLILVFGSFYTVAEIRQLLI